MCYRKPAVEATLRFRATSRVYDAPALRWEITLGRVRMRQDAHKNGDCMDQQGTGDCMNTLMCGVPAVGLAGLELLTHWLRESRKPIRGLDVAKAEIMRKIENT